MKATSAKQRQELADLGEKNKELDELNQKLGHENNQQEAELASLVKKVEINSLLQDVDMEEVNLMSKQNADMESSFMQVMIKLKTVQRRAEEKLIQA
jgi:hypothetical protein